MKFQGYEEVETVNWQDVQELEPEREEDCEDQSCYRTVNRTGAFSYGAGKDAFGRDISLRPTPAPSSSLSSTDTEKEVCSEQGTGISSYTCMDNLEMAALERSEENFSHVSKKQKVSNFDLAFAPTPTPTPISNTVNNDPLAEVVNPHILKRKTGGWRTKK